MCTDVVPLGTGLAITEVHTCFITGFESKFDSIIWHICVINMSANMCISAKWTDDHKGTEV